MRSVFVAFLLVLLATGVSAQSPSKVIGRANKALGGEKVLKGIRSWRAAGTITRPSDGATGAYESEASAGNLYAESYDLNGFEYAVGFNGKSGWARDSRDGLRTLTGNAARDFQAEAIFRNSRWLNAKAEKVKITTAGTASVSGATADIVVLSTAKGNQIKVFIDQASGLVVREEFPRGGISKVLEYGDYRSVNGIMTPFRINLRSDDEVLEIKLRDVAYNQGVERARFDFPRASDEPIPDISKLFEEIRANAEKIDEILENYSYTELRIDREVGPDGNLVEKSSEKRLLTFYKGYRVNRLIEKNGRALSPGEQEKEDRDAQKQVEDIERRIAEKERKAANQRDTGSGTGGTPNGEGQRITIADALKGSILTNPRRERYRNNDVIVFDFEPNPQFKPQTRMEKLFAICTGAVWVDSKTKQVVRLDAVLTKSAGNFLAKAKRGASFTLENTLINDEIWLPSQADINLSIKILFAGININNLIKYGDYSKFKTEVKDATVDEVKKP